MLLFLWKNKNLMLLTGEKVIDSMEQNLANGHNLRVKKKLIKNNQLVKHQWIASNSSILNTRKLGPTFLIEGI